MQEKPILLTIWEAQAAARALAEYQKRLAELQAAFRLYQERTARLLQFLRILNANSKTEFSFKS